jgi:hypothetical protein
MHTQFAGGHSVAEWHEKQSEPAGGSFDLQNMHALLIGIEHYPNLQPALGARQDAANMTRYLLSRNARAEQMTTLLNEQATGSAVLAALKNMIESPDIEQNAPLLFYFSGHGSRFADTTVCAPDGHADTAECIVLYDSVALPDQRPLSVGLNHQHGETSVLSQREDLAIPDRTIGALLRRLAQAKGNNITIVLDCGFAGPVARISTASTTFHARSVPSELLHPLYSLDEPTGDSNRPSDSVAFDDCRKDLVTAGQRSIVEQTLDLRSASHLEGCDTRLKAPAESSPDDVANDPQQYVDLRRSTTDLNNSCSRAALCQWQQCGLFDLLAASCSDEPVWGSSSGGIFTLSLLSALNDPRTTYHWTYGHLYTEICRRYYDELTRIVSSQSDKPSFDAFANASQPIYLGTDRNRVLFFPLESGMCTEANVTRGCECAIDVVETEEDSRIQNSCKALASRMPLKVAIHNTLPYSADSVRIFELLKDRVSSWDSRSTGHELSQAQPIASLALTASEDAEVVLEADANGVIIIQKTPALQDTHFPAPRLSEENLLLVFPDVLGSLAAFIRCLSSLTSEINTPGARLMSANLSLKVLIRMETLGSIDKEAEHVSFGMLSGSGKPSTPVLLADRPYALILDNRSKQNLYPYVFVLEPETLAIRQLYTPPAGEQPPLKAGQLMQLDRSAGCTHDLIFSPAACRDTLYAAIVVLLSCQVLQLPGMEQEPMFEYGTDGQLRVREGGLAGPQGILINNGAWTATAQMVFARRAPCHDGRCLYCPRNCTCEHCQ